MSQDQTPLILTCPNLSFQFTEFEVPDQLKSLGGSQMEATHKFPGGRKVIQTFGAFPHDVIKWSGIIQGVGAFQRAVLLDSIRQGGLQCTLSWGFWKYSGILGQLEIDPKNQAWIPYTAEFVTADDQSQAGPTSSTPSQVAAFGSLSGAITSLCTAYAGTSAIILSSIPQITGVLGAVATGINAAGGALDVVAGSFLAAQGAILTTVLDTLAPIGPVPAIGAQVDLVAGLVDTNEAMTDLIWQQQQTYLLQQLLFLLSIPPVNVRVVTVSDPCLLLLGAQFFGDAEAGAAAIQAANPGVQIFATGILNLVIPGAI